MSTPITGATSIATTGATSTPTTGTTSNATTGEPAVMLWAWESPDDMRALDTRRAGVAFLAGEVQLGATARVTGQRQPLLLAPGTWLMAVVRLEPTPQFRDSPALRDAAVRALLRAAALPGVQGLQIDFDATVAQRDFYIAVAREARLRLPPDMPLSMTALADWCAAGKASIFRTGGALARVFGSGGWLRQLDVDERVPMFFRMGGPRSGAAERARSFAAITDPACRASVGISTDERAPDAVPQGTRVYVFHPGPWVRDELARAVDPGYVRFAGRAR